MAAQAPADGGTTLSRSASWQLAVLVLLLAFNLRMIFPSLAVLLPEIRVDTGLSGTLAGWLTTLPVLCMGVFSALAPWCAGRFGIERSLFLALCLIAIGTALRGSGVPGLFVGAALAGAAIAVSNVLLPALVKRDFAARSALLTALYAASLNAGGALSAAATQPLMRAIQGEWPVGLAMWALPPALVAVLWLPWIAGRARPGAARGSRVAGLWRSPLAWQVTLFMGLQSALAYCVSGWLAPILRARGMEATSAGLVTSIGLLTTVAGGLLVPALVARCRDQRGLNLGFALLAGLPLFGLLYAPLPGAWLWAVLQGIGQGGMFTMALTVIVLRSPDTRTAAGLSGMAQGVGYVVASGGPLAVGLLSEASGGFAGSGGLFAGILLLALICGWAAGRLRQVPAVD